MNSTGGRKTQYPELSRREWKCIHNRKWKARNPEAARQSNKAAKLRFKKKRDMDPELNARMKALSAERVRRCRARKKAIEQLALLTESCGGEPPSQILSDGLMNMIPQ